MHLGLKKLIGLSSLTLVLLMTTACGDGGSGGGASKCTMSFKDFAEKLLEAGLTRGFGDVAKADSLCKDIKAKVPDGCEMTANGKSEIIKHDADFKQICP